MRYGDVFTLQLSAVRHARHVVVIANPEATQKLFRDPSLTTTGASRDAIAAVFGTQSILVTDGAIHARQRRAMRAWFRTPSIARHADLVTLTIDSEIDRWIVGQPFALRPRIQAVALAVNLTAVLGLTDPERGSIITRRVHRLVELVTRPAATFALGLPTKAGRFDLRAAARGRRRQLDVALHREIARRRADADLAERTDILAHLITYRDECGDALSSAEISDQVVTLLLAGYETTATALAWTIDELLHSPPTLSHVVAEARNPDADGRYLDASIAESLRLHPPLPVVQRALRTSVQVGGFEIPPSTVIMLCGHLLHRRADLYSQPTAFRPERFLGASPQLHHWIPFGGGSRRCVGASFALLQMGIILRRIFARAELRPQKARVELIRRRGIVFAPALGTRAVLDVRLAAERVGSQCMTESSAPKHCPHPRR